MTLFKGQANQGLGKKSNSFEVEILKKRIILLDTNFSAKPIYDYLIKTGAEVLVVGANPRPQDSLARLVDNYINLDYSNVIEVKKLISTLNIDYLVPGGNDFSYKICSEISKDMGFYNIDLPEVNDQLINKEKFRKFTADLGVHAPRLLEYNEIKTKLPVIIKPADAYSGHGMTVISDFDEVKIQNAVKLAEQFSNSQSYLIEEFIQGQLFSHSAFVADGVIIKDFIVEEHCIVNPYVVDTSRVVNNFDAKILEQIRSDISVLVRKLDLKDGLIHSQFICDGRSFWIIEVTRRCPGDLYSKLIEYSTGFPYAEYYSKPFLNLKIDFADKKIPEIPILRHTITQSRASYFSSLSFSIPILIKEYIQLVETGYKVEESPYGRIGVMFLRTNTKEDMDSLFQQVLNRKLYTIQELDI